MILDARESRDHQLSRAPKILKILRLVFARDDFEKVRFQIIVEIPLILLTFFSRIPLVLVLSKKTQLDSVADSLQFFPNPMNL